MIEAFIEKTIIGKIKELFTDTPNAQVFGVWDVTDNELKGEEDKKSELIIGVKAFPRSYETPTVPYCSIEVQISLASRVDEDWNGKGYLSAVSRISDVLQGWQNDFSSLYTFDFPDCFKITGFQLMGGDCGVDRESGIWQWSQRLGIYGIVNKPSTDVPPSSC